MAQNNNLSAKRFEKQLAGILTAVYGVQSVFRESFPSLQTDAVRESATAFSVKTNNTAVVVGTYNTGANVGFGTGTSNSSRFGNRTEIIYGSEDVPYSDVFTIHEGIDRFTVNNDLTSAVADRLELHAQALVRKLNGVQGKALIESATSVAPGATMKATFSALDTAMTDLEVVGQLVAYVSPQAYNAIIDENGVDALMSSMDIEGNKVLEYKGFRLIKVPTKYLTDGATTDPVTPDIVATVANIGVSFTGIDTARTIESEDFDGVALQAGTKVGTYILEDNKKAIFEVTLP